MTDDRMDLIIANLLRTGVILAAATVAAGGVWYHFEFGADPVTYKSFHAGPHSIRSILQMGHSQLLILIGLLILIATPVARVVFSLVAFSLERDWVFVWITSVVLAILLYSMVAAWW